jgi:hypothetical protein
MRTRPTGNRRWGEGEDGVQVGDVAGEENRVNIPADIGIGGGGNAASRGARNNGGGEIDGTAWRDFCRAFVRLFLIDFAPVRLGCSLTPGGVSLDWLYGPYRLSSTGGRYRTPYEGLHTHSRQLVVDKSAKNAKMQKCKKTK